MSECNVSIESFNCLKSLLRLQFRNILFSCRENKSWKWNWCLSRQSVSVRDKIVNRGINQFGNTGRKIGFKQIYNWSKYDANLGVTRKHWPRSTDPTIGPGPRTASTDYQEKLPKESKEKHSYQDYTKFLHRRHSLPRFRNEINR